MPKFISIFLNFGTLKVIPTHYLNFEFCAVCLLFIRSNNVTGAYLIIMLVFKLLLTKHLQSTVLPSILVIFGASWYVGFENATFFPLSSGIAVSNIT